MTTYIRFFDYDSAFNYYCNLISKMRQGYNHKNFSRIIAKPALVLSIIKLIEKGKSVNLFTYEEIDDTYKSIFGKYFIEACHGHIAQGLFQVGFGIRSEGSKGAKGFFSLFSLYSP